MVLFSNNRSRHKNRLDYEIAHLTPDQLKIYNEWLRRSSRYTSENIWLYIAVDKDKKFCKVGISVRTPKERLWDIGYRCFWGVLLPNLTSRRIEALMTAKYRYSNDDSTQFNGYREVYPYKLKGEITMLVFSLVPKSSIIDTAEVNA